MSSDNEILPQQAPSWGRRLAGLDGLRGTALLGILLAHVIIFLPEKDGVYTGAQVAGVGLLSHSLTFFFVLSAFLLYRPFASAIIKDRPNPPTYDFYRNRVLRVWPAYLVVLVIVGFGFGLTVVDKDAPTLEGLGRLTDPVLLITNVLLVQGYSPTTAFTGLGVSWSLITEIGFYAMLPPLGYLGVKLARRGRVFAAIMPGLLLLVIGVASRITSLAWNGWEDVRPESTWNAVFDRSTIVQCDLFGAGMIAAALLVASGSMSDEKQARLRRILWAIIAVCFVAVVLLGSGQKLTSFMGIAFGAGIVLTQVRQPDRASRALVRVMDTAPPRLAGEISLSCYLWHYPILLWLMLHVDDDIIRYGSNLELMKSWAILTVPTLILGAITYRLVELPAMRRKRRTDRKPVESKPEPA
jgi:peptidoglycan/LPS O-acetylase OafA/YrhL